MGSAALSLFGHAKILDTLIGMGSAALSLFGHAEISDTMIGMGSAALAAPGPYPGKMTPTAGQSSPKKATHKNPTTTTTTNIQGKRLCRKQGRKCSLGCRAAELCSHPRRAEKPARKSRPKPTSLTGRSWFCLLRGQFSDFAIRSDNSRRHAGRVTHATWLKLRK